MKWVLCYKKGIFEEVNYFVELEIINNIELKNFVICFNGEYIFILGKEFFFICLYFVKIFVIDLSNIMLLYLNLNWWLYD